MIARMSVGVSGVHRCHVPWRSLRDALRVLEVSLIVVVLGVSIVAGARWSQMVLTEEDRYLRAVSPLANSPLFARLAGASVSYAARRHRWRRRRALPPRPARAVGTATRWAMGTRAFGPSWSVCHRVLHRFRHRQPHWRVTALMILLAIMGPIVGAASRMVAPAAARTR